MRATNRSGKDSTDYNDVPGKVRRGGILLLGALPIRESLPLIILLVASGYSVLPFQYSQRPQL